MELIKKNYKIIISYGIIFLGVLSLIVVLCVRPQKTSAQELYHYGTDSITSQISLPYPQTIPIQTNALDYIELSFGDDSINKYEYTIIASKESEILFKHTYKDEQSNIIRVPLAEHSIKPDDVISIQISCDTTCNDVKFKLYETENGPAPKIAVVSRKLDYRYLWYPIFTIVVGLILIPLAKGENK